MWGGFADCREVRRLQEGFADVEFKELKLGDSSGACGGILDVFLSRVDVFLSEVTLLARARVFWTRFESC